MLQHVLDTQLYADFIQESGRTDKEHELKAKLEKEKKTVSFTYRIQQQHLKFNFRSKTFKRICRKFQKFRMILMRDR